MKTHWYAKLFGWGQFALVTFTHILNSGGSIATVPGAIAVGSSLLAAIGIHAASSTDGAK